LAGEIRAALLWVDEKRRSRGREVAAGYTWEAAAAAHLQLYERLAS
jgi:hypothetical protein